MVNLKRMVRESKSAVVKKPATQKEILAAQAAKMVRDARIYAGMPDGLAGPRRRVGQAEVARLIGAGVPTVCKLEQGEIQVTAAVLLIMAKEFNISLDSFTGVDKAFKDLKGEKRALAEAVAGLTPAGLQALRNFAALPAEKQQSALLFAQEAMGEDVKQIRPEHTPALRAAAAASVRTKEHGQALGDAVEGFAALSAVRAEVLAMAADFLANPDVEWDSAVELKLLLEWLLRRIELRTKKPGKKALHRAMSAEHREKSLEKAARALMAEPPRRAEILLSVLRYAAKTPVQRLETLAAAAEFIAKPPAEWDSAAELNLLLQWLRRRRGNVRISMRQKEDWRS